MLYLGTTEAKYSHMAWRKRVLKCALPKEQCGLIGMSEAKCGGEGGRGSVLYL